MNRLLLTLFSIVMLPILCESKQKEDDLLFRENTMIKIYCKIPTEGAIVFFCKENDGKVREIVYDYNISDKGNKSGFTCTKGAETLASIQKFTKKDFDYAETSDEFNTNSFFYGYYRNLFPSGFFETSNQEKIAIFDSISNVSRACVDTIITRKYIYKQK